MSKDRRNITSEDLKKEVMEKITKYTQNGFPEARRIHEIIMEANPDLSPRLWYGMPGYSKTKDSAVICFFRKDSLITFGITESANIENSQSVVPSSWYITKLNSDAEDHIRQIVIQTTS